MTHEFNEDRSQLILVKEDCDTESLEYAFGVGEEKGWVAAEAEFMSDYLANCELQWISPSDTGDLTDAPMLGITGEEISAIGEFPEAYGFIPASCDTVIPVLERWAFMSYAVRSFLSDLDADGKAVFTNSN